MILALTLLTSLAGAEEAEPPRASAWQVPAPLAPPVAPPGDDPFQWLLPDVVVAPGQPALATLRLAVPDGHMIYRDQLQVVVLSADGVQVGEVDLPPALLQPDPFTPNVLRELYDMDVVVHLPVWATVSEGEGRLRLELRHQGCRPGLCYAPQVHEAEVLVPVDPDTEEATDD